ncbi:MAG: TIGR03560 family F420-dependent LLM class oxidoreductase [Actinobacteria bacterium]|nr:TIGR03560 family F420-dependent LLM class oxidoreductase [Actinomycetota bacterium]
MRFGLDVSQHQLGWDEILERTRFAESSGFDGAWVFDHFKPLYGDRKGPCFEGWTLLAALAAATERIRLGALVTGVTYRHPSVLAAEAVTVDHVSNGRLELGMGAAWFEQEHRELGIDFPRPGERVRRLDEAVQVMTLLMTGDDVSFKGRHYRLRGASYNPKPVQHPHPPIWIGGGGERKMLPLAARRADVWHGFGDVERLLRKSSLVDREARKAGRDPASIGRSTSLSLSEPWDEVRRRLDLLGEGGFDYFTVSWPSEGKARLDEFVSDVMPHYASA